MILYLWDKIKWFYIRVMHGMGFDVVLFCRYNSVAIKEVALYNRVDMETVV